MFAGAAGEGATAIPVSGCGLGLLDAVPVVASADSGAVSGCGLGLSAVPVVASADSGAVSGCGLGLSAVPVAWRRC